MLRSWPTTTVSSLAVMAALIAPMDHAGAVTAGEGALDPSFGNGGLVADWGAVDQVGRSMSGEAVTRDASQRILVAGADASGRWYVLRLRPDGSTDPSFGEGGLAQWDADGAILGGPSAIAVDKSGRVVVAGSGGGGTHPDDLIARFTSSGSLDSTFAGTGYRAFNIDTDTARSAIADMAIQPDGKIVIGGYAASDMFVARLRPGGSFDSAFGTAGVARTNMNQSTSLGALALLPDGRILGVGDENDSGFSGFGLARWTPSGQLDTSFNGTGERIDLIGSAVHDHARDVALLPNGQFVVVGSAQWADDDEIVLRYNADGSLDTNWATDGYRNLNHGQFEEFSSVAVQRDGKILAVGNADYGTSGVDFSVVRLTGAGDPDPTFAGDGDRSVDYGGGDDYATGLTLGRDGRLLVVGVAAGKSRAAVGLAELVGDATAPHAPTVAALPRYTLASSVVLRWSGASDDNTGVHSYVVEGRSTRYDASTPGPAGVLRRGITARSWRTHRVVGRTSCFVVAATDYAGNTGVPGNERCTAWPVDDRTMVRHGNWSSGKGKAYYLGTFRRSTSSGASLTLKVAFRHVALVATMCAACGKVRVYLGKTLLATKSLHSSKTRNRVVIPVASAGTVRTGTLRIVQVSGGHAVTIDGVAVSVV